MPDRGNGVRRCKATARRRDAVTSNIHNPDEEHAVSPKYTAIVQQRENWWIGWIEEVPGVISQGATREELLENLSSALREALEMNRADALEAAQGPYEEVGIAA
jgi:predicted RNase H-like HicB family nuclease